MKKRLYAILVAGLAAGCFAGTAAVAQETETVTYTKPYLLTLNPDNEMNICWLTKESTEAFVEFGETEELGTDGRSSRV